MSNQQDLGFAMRKTNDGPVECLGLMFKNDDARRTHFLKLLREKLQDTEFRNTPGFPTGSDEAILRMSDPPYHTACPNPFIEDFVRAYGKPYDPTEEYEREPFAVDVQGGKFTSLYKAHSYHTKVPHLAIAPLILHYTLPGEVVLDGFCGSGMTGVAVKWCELASSSERQELANEWRAIGRADPVWGARHVVLSDLSPAATFIAANYLAPIAADRFEERAAQILDELRREIGWMYETRTHDGVAVHMEYMVWSEVFICHACSGEIVFEPAAVDRTTWHIRDEISCPQCGATSRKEQMELVFTTVVDQRSGKPKSVPKRVPVSVFYRSGSALQEKKPDEQDLAVVARVEQLSFPLEIPTDRFPDCQMLRVGRMATTRIESVHDLFLPRAAHCLAALWRKALAEPDPHMSRFLLFLFEQAIWGLSALNRYQPSQHENYGGSQVNRQLNGVYYVSSMIAECSPWHNLGGKIGRLASAFRAFPSRSERTIIATGTAASTGLPNNSVDYIFTDPPFGENIYYADLNFLVESWYGVFTNDTSEAIVDRVRGKDILAYQRLMERCFAEYHRVLKPARWMTVVFSNSKNGVWRAIQEALGAAGFVVADVRTLDKKVGSFKQVTSSAVKQDLIISVYKPTETLAHRFELGHATAEGAWAFVKEHLGNVPVFVGRASEGEVVAERTAQLLLDRTIAFHVQRGISVPLSGPEFLQGLAQRFPERDGMYFLPEQVAEYDRKRTSVAELRQLSLFVNDEASAIQWVRQQLQDRPQSFQDLQPQFMRELQTLAKHEKTVELRQILVDGFGHYDGRGPVPNQIHAYLSSNFRELRNLEKDDGRLREKAADRWYVLDPTKQADQDQIRERQLLKEFVEYKASTQRKLKLFRTEAVRAGFKACWQERDYRTIVKVAEKLPEAVLQEDEKLLMYYDNALTRLGDA
ncbi:MAG: hypothetical protein JNK64_01025 [Myxococcales bacterium]|nr:hypothetical protein [Myxococcales bacterium]